MKVILALVVSAAVISSPALAGAKTKKKTEAASAAAATPAKFEKGLLVDSKGMTLYCCLACINSNCDRQGRWRLYRDHA